MHLVEFFLCSFEQNILQRLLITPIDCKCVDENVSHLSKVHKAYYDTRAISMCKINFAVLQNRKKFCTRKTRNCIAHDPILQVCHGPTNIKFNILGCLFVIAFRVLME